MIAYDTKGSPYCHSDRFLVYEGSADVSHAPGGRPGPRVHAPCIAPRAKGPDELLESEPGDRGDDADDRG